MMTEPNAASQVQAAIEGAEAARQGMPESSNPYERERDEHWVWAYEWFATNCMEAMKDGASARIAF